MSKKRGGVCPFASRAANAQKRAAKARAIKLARRDARHNPRNQRLLVALLLGLLLRPNP